MNRSDLEKLSKEEIIDLFLTIHDHFQTKIAELEARLNQTAKTAQNHPQLTSGKNPNPHAKKQAKNPAHNPDTKDTD